MLKSEFCTLKVLNLRDNFIKQSEGEHMVACMKVNKAMLRFDLALNPVKASVLEDMEKLCKRNHNLDTANDKSKNIIKMVE